MQVYTHACSHLIQSSIWPSVIALTEHYIYLISSICTSFLRLDKGNFDEYQDGWICSSRLHCRMNNRASATLTLSTSCFFFWRFFRETLLRTCITDMRHGPATYIYPRSNFYPDNKGWWPHAFALHGIWKSLGLITIDQQGKITTVGMRLVQTTQPRPHCTWYSIHTIMQVACIANRLAYTIC